MRVPVRSLLCNLKFSGLAFAIFLNQLLLDFENPILADFYPQIGASPEIRGFLVLTYASPWIILGNLAHKISPRFIERKNFIFIGYILVATGVAF